MTAQVLLRAVQGEPVTREEAALVLRAFARGEAPPESLASLLTALHIHGEGTPALLGFVEVLREHMIPVPVRTREAIDLCGTGGDGQATVNLSTAAAFVVAGAGVSVAKHGNHGISSRCGSADVLRALGISLEQSPEQIAESIDVHGLGFIYAPAHHPLFGRIGPVRRALGFRTAFNLLGPVCNPAGVRRQLVGAATPEVQQRLAEILSALGCERALVVHTPGPFDEVTLSAPTRTIWVEGGELIQGTLAASDFGTGSVPPEVLAGGDADFNAARIESVLRDEDGPLRDVVCANAACALWVAGRVGNPREGFARARASIASGAALAKLELLRRNGGAKTP
jgi:anthranilate phosphoribosyltransferase